MAIKVYSDAYILSRPIEVYGKHVSQSNGNESEFGWYDSRQSCLRKGSLLSVQINFIHRV